MKINKLYSVWSNDNPRCNFTQQVRANSKQEACLLYSIYNGVNIQTVQVAKLVQPRTVLVCPITRANFRTSF